MSYEGLLNIPAIRGDMMDLMVQSSQPLSAVRKPVSNLSREL